MTFTASTTPDITEGVPAELSTATAPAAKAARGRIRWDLSVDGLGFVLGINDQNPYLRESAPVQKQQFDTSQEAGEQTLDGYWIRSQTSWHLGAGVNFYEPGARDGATPSAYRFDRSAGVDVWTEGEARLLKRTAQSASTASTQAFVASARVAGADVYFSQVAGAVSRVAADGTATAYTPSSASAEGRVAVAGSKVLVGAAGAGIDAGDIGGSALTRLYTQTLAATPIPYWVKGRIIATRGRQLFELALDGSTGTTAGNLDTVTPLYTHPDAGWTWSGVSESPSAILAAGYSGGTGAIFSFTLEADTAGTTPKLGQPFQVAEFPPGEEVHSIAVYLGTYIGIGTSKGLRVGIIGGNGDLQYGPLLFQTAAPVRALAARDRFLYAGVEAEIDGGSGCARVDLGAQIGNGLVFPWAWDAQSHTAGPVVSVAFVGASDRVVLGVSGQGVYAQSATLFETTGYLSSGAVRYGTTEAKAFRFADVRCRTESASAVALSTIGPDGEETGIVTLRPGSTGANLSLARLAQKLEYLSYKVTLTPSADGTVSPVVESVALKAVPVTRKQRLIQYPVMLQDKVQDSTNSAVFMRAADVIARLEDLESDKAVVQVVDYRLGESYPGVIETFRFTGTTPAKNRPGAVSNGGGRGEITMRKLA